MSYKNFNGLFMITPNNYYIPNSVPELQRYVKKNEHVRIQGSNHAFNDIILTDDTIINMKKLNFIDKINTKRQTVKVEAGIKLYKLLDHLEKNNLALPI